MGCSQSKSRQSTMVEEARQPTMAESGASESTAESVLEAILPDEGDSVRCSNESGQQESTQQNTWRFISATQSQANKRCCGSYCAILNHSDCCDHSPRDMTSYCTLCQERCRGRYQDEERNKQILARKLMEETINNHEVCRPCRSDTENDSHGESEAEECPICLEPQQYPCDLVCGHTFCIAHVDKLDSCPLCRHPIDSTRTRSGGYSLDDPYPFDPIVHDNRNQYIRSNMAQQAEGWLGDRDWLGDGGPHPVVSSNQTQQADAWTRRQAYRMTRRRGVGGLIDDLLRIPSMFSR
jgi:hypothetical protein